jgi:hypothetical protein
MTCCPPPEVHIYNSKEDILTKRGCALCYRQRCSDIDYFLFVQWPKIFPNLFSEPNKNATQQLRSALVKLGWQPPGCRYGIAAWHRIRVPVHARWSCPESMLMFGRHHTATASIVHNLTITACTCIRDVATVRTFKNLTLSKDERICDFVADGLKMSMEAFLLQCSFYVNGHRVHQPWRLRGSNIDRCRVLIAMTWWSFDKFAHRSYRIQNYIECQVAPHKMHMVGKHIAKIVTQC